MSGAAHARPADRFLPEVQALRAVAVALVVLYHLWPGRLPGGFIGVDVFFVISGFLITAHLVRDYESNGRIGLLEFWSRRIRRLLPAAFVVLAASVVLVFTVLPSVVREATLRQIAAASGYILNWVLAADSVDYLAAENAPTIVQHYWTLSVEEQFYIAWPLLLVAIGAIVVRSRRRASPTGLIGIIGAAVVALSFGYSVWLTVYSPSVAYFATTTRAWEFAAGGLLAVVFARWPALVERVRSRRPAISDSALSLGGLALIIASSFVISGETPFPGAIAALPVVGTLLVILGGTPTSRPLALVTRWRPVQFVGDISYSLYLWHWPLITALIVVLGRRPSVLEGLGIIAASVILATLTKHFVEDPGRRSAVLRNKRAAFAFAGAGVLVFVAVWTVSTTVSTNQINAEHEATVAAIADTSGCFGANAVLGTAECPDPYLLDSSVDLTAAAADLDADNWCLTWFDQDWASCEIGAENGSERWALVGDSHAASMVEAFDEYFAERDITIVTFTRFGCDGYRSPNGFVATTEQEAQDVACLEWADRVRGEIAERDDLDAVIYLNRTPIYTNGSKISDVSVDDILANWENAVDSGKRVAWIKDWPVTAGDSIPVCLSTHVGEDAPCSLERDVALPPDPQDTATGLFDGDVAALDLSDAFCDDSRCYSVIGGVVVYPDHNHISGTYSRTLMPYLGPALIEALGSR